MIRRYGRTCRSYADDVKTFTHDGIGFKCIKKQDRLRGEDYYVVIVSDLKYPHGGYIEVVDADSMDEAIEYFCSHFTPNPNRDGTVTLIRSRSATMYAPRRRMYGRRQASGALRHRRAGKENWYMGIEGAWSVGGNEWSPSQITYYGCPVDADSVDNMVYEEFRYYCEDNGLEESDSEYKKWFRTNGKSATEDAIAGSAEAMFDGYLNYLKNEIWMARIDIKENPDKYENLISQFDEYTDDNADFRMPFKARFTRDMAEALNVKTDEDKMAFMVAVKEAGLEDEFDMDIDV